MTAARTPRPVGLLDHAFGAGLASAYVAVLVKTARGLGYARDEGFYFRAAESYAHWFETLAHDPKAAFARSAVDAAWGTNHEHPGFVKSCFALSWIFLQKKWHLFAEEGTSFRFGGMALSALALWVLYIWGARARSRTVGVAAALSYALMPRVFYHAHLDCFDAPIATMWMLCAYAYWRSLQAGGVAWALAAGVTFGLALDTKHNSWFLPIMAVAHTLLSRGPSILRELRRGVLRVPLALPAMALIGPLVFVGLWPWLWFDTAQRFAGYVQFHLGHDYYNMVFLGETYWKPPMPRGYAWLMTAATVPTITLVLFVTGLASRAWARLRRVEGDARDRAATDLLWLLSLGVCYAPWLSTKTPIFGGTKHWLTAYPFLCLFAGVGFEWTLRTARGWLASVRPSLASARWVDGAIGACVVVAPLVETVQSHPWGLCFYTPLVGEAPGAASLGLNRQFWGYTTGAVTDWINQHVPPSASLYIHDTAWDSWDMLRRDGRIQPHVQAAWQIHTSSVALYHHEDHMEGVEYQEWVALGSAAPVHVATYQGVPIIWIHAKPGVVRTP